MRIATTSRLWESAINYIQLRRRGQRLAIGDHVLDVEPEGLVRVAVGIIEGVTGPDADGKSGKSTT
jgi:hypothetical protein